jgi:hypothetical protein
MSHLSAGRGAGIGTAAGAGAAAGHGAKAPGVVWGILANGPAGGHTIARGEPIATTGWTCGVPSAPVQTT